MSSLQQNRFKVRMFHKALAFANWLATLPNRMTPPPFRLIQIGSAFWQSRALYVAAKLGVADSLVGGERGTAELAEELTLHEDNLYRLLRMLSSIGVFMELPGRRFTHSKLSEYLRSDHPQTVRDMVLMHNSPQMSTPWMEALEPAIRSGEIPFQRSHGATLFDYMDQHPEFDALFSRAMDAVEGLTGTAYLQDFDWSRFERIIDVGGSLGSKSIAILEQHPGLKALVFDRPPVIAGAAQHWQELGKEALLERMEFAGGDMLQKIPQATGPGDLYLFVAVFHGMGDEEANRVLDQLQQAMRNSGARALIADTVAEECGIDPTVAGFDMQMLMGTRGRERTHSEWQTLLQQSGLQIDEIVDIRSFPKFIVVSSCAG